MADIGTNALSSAKLLGLLELVNVRMPSKDDGGVAPKLPRRLCTRSAEGIQEISPATVLALALVSRPTGAEAAFSFGRVLAASSLTHVFVLSQGSRPSWYGSFWIWFYGLC